MKPSIGRIVHFIVTPGENPVAAIVTAVWSDVCVNLRIFQDGSNTQPTQFSEWVTSASFDDSAVPQVRTWHWPPKV